MKRSEYREQFVAAMREMHDEGHEWVYALDVAGRISMSPEDLQRAQMLRRALGFIGINRPSQPKIPYQSKIYPAIIRLQEQGLVRGQWEQPGMPPGADNRRLYQLTELH